MPNLKCHNYNNGQGITKVDTQKDQCKEKIYDLCFEHEGLVDLNKIHPDLKFNRFINFPSRECGYANCKVPAYYKFIGVCIPEYATVSSEFKNSNSIVFQEIFSDAKFVFDKGPSLNTLTEFLKTQLIPHRDREPGASQIIRQLAALLLEKLKIDKESTLDDREKYKILKILKLIPADYYL